MKPGLISSTVDNSQWKIHGDLLLPQSYQEQAREEVIDAPQEPELDEEEDDDEPLAKPQVDLASEIPQRPSAPPPTPRPATPRPPVVDRFQSERPPGAPRLNMVSVPVKSARPGDEIPKNWWIMLAAVLGLGLVLVIWVKRPQIKGGSTLPNTNNPQEQPAIAPQPGQPMPVFDINAYEQARDAKFQDALKKARAIWGSCGQVCKARRDYYIAKAEEILKQTGRPIEVTLMRELSRQLGEQMKVLPYYSELGGYTTEESDQVGIARSLSGDALALLEALDWEWTRQRQLAAGQPLPARTSTTVDMAPLSKDMADLWQLGAMARNTKPQQQLRDSLADEEPKPPVKETSPKPKPEESDKPKESEPKPEKVVGVPK